MGLLLCSLLNFLISPFLPHAKITKGELYCRDSSGKNSSTPIYRQLDASLRRLILDGTLEPGQQLPSARELAKDLGISHITVKTVYEQIAAEGCVEAKTGAGIFVAQGLELEASREFKCISRKPPFPKVKLNERARTIMWRAGSQQCLSDSSLCLSLASCTVARTPLIEI